MTQLQVTSTPDGRRLEASQVVSAPADVAWEYLVDTKRWPEWSLTISAVESSDRRIRAGTTGRVRVPGVWLPFEVTSCADRRWTWRVARMSATGHRVEDLGNGRSRFVFELPLRGAGYAPVCLRALERLDRLLDEEGTVRRDN
jgi:hypothetical protein